MKRPYSHKLFVYAALLLWLFASGSGMHGHFCFDGNEPPVSVHFDLLDKHEGHAEPGHQDADSKPAQIDVLKVSNQDLPFLAALLLLVVVWPLVREQKYRTFNTPLSWASITGIRPPLRAPPIHSR